MVIWQIHREGFAMLYIPLTPHFLRYSSWYQEDCSRSDAQEKLMSQPVGAFLIRGSQSAAPGDFSISVRCLQCVSMCMFEFRVVYRKTL